MVRSSFMTSVFDAGRREEAILNATVALSSLPLNNLTLVGTGLSGAMMLTLLSHHTKTPCTLVRKKNSSSHSNLEIEGEMDFDDYVIIDDQIDTGATIEHITNVIKSKNPRARLAGILLYECHNYDAEHEDWGDRFDCWVREI